MVYGRSCYNEPAAAPEMNRRYRLLYKHVSCFTRPRSRYKWSPGMLDIERLGSRVNFVCRMCPASPLNKGKKNKKHRELTEWRRG